MKRLALLLVFASTAVLAEPYKILMVADTGATHRARKFQDYLRAKPPFNRMSPQDLEIEIVTASKDELNCGNRTPASPRVINCNTPLLAQMKAREEAHLAVVFTSTADGGSGGEFPMASTNYPVSTMFHEMLHTYGFDDEYTYSQSETRVYCGNRQSRTNVAYFQDRPPYRSDSEARSRHQRDVPWMDSIPVVKLITQGTELGSPNHRIESGEQVMGLYRGGPCDLVIKSWRPYQNSIMRSFTDDTVYPLYENAIIESIEASLGRRLSFRMVQQQRPQRRVVASLPEPEPEEECATPSEVRSTIEDMSSILKKLAY